jgi:hypothetical protein
MRSANEAIYVCAEPTHPTSEAVHITSPAETPKRYLIDNWSPTACPPASLTTPFGAPVVPNGSVHLATWPAPVSCTALTACVNDVHRVAACDWDDRCADPPHLCTFDKPLPIPLPFFLHYGMPSQLLSLPYDRRWRLKRAPADGVPDEISIRNRALPGLDATRSSHYCHRFGRLDSLRQRWGGKPSKDHGVDRAQPVDGEHCEQCCRYHRHVNQNHVTFSHAILPQYSGQSLNLVKEVDVTVFLPFARNRALPYDCRGISVACVYVPVDTVVARRDFAAREPGPGTVASSVLEGFRAQL